MMIYSIKLSKLKKKSDFETFMLDEVFPAVDKSLGRAGQVTGLVLLRGSNTDFNTDQYLWFVYGTNGGGAAKGQLNKIEAFGAQISDMGEFREDGSWFAEG